MNECDRLDCIKYDSDKKLNCNLTPAMKDLCLENNYSYYLLSSNISNPKHYTQYKKEVIDIIKDCLTDEEFKGYLKGNIIKYRMRAGLKDDRDQDISKSNWYQDRLKDLK